MNRKPPVPPRTVDERIPGRAEHEARLWTLDRDARVSLVRGLAAGTLLFMLLAAPLVYALYEMKARLS